MSIVILLIAFLLSLVIVIFIMIDIIRWLHSKVLFQPLSSIGSYPTYPYQDLMINTRSRQVIPLSQFTAETHDFQNWINFWHFTNDPKHPTIIFCHGNYGNITHRSYITDFCQALQINLVVFDYRGYGRSTGFPTLEKFYHDGQVIYDYLVNQVPSDKIIIWGESLGGAVALKLAQNNPCSHLILLCTFSTLDDIIFLRHPNNILTLSMKYLLPLIVDNIHNVDVLRTIKCPVVIIHSSEDETIPYACAEKNFANINHNKKKFVTIKGGHTTPIMTKEDIFTILDFIEISPTRRITSFLSTWLSQLTNFVKTIKP